MPDREKVIKGLKHCKSTWMCNGCPYEDDSTDDCTMYDDALALLREQKPTRWIIETDRMNHYHCEKCGYTAGIVAYLYKFCPGCGRMVIHDAPSD